MAYKQYVLHGHVTLSMWLVVAFQGWYVMDSLISEVCILTTMDIVNDGFGWMLAFGDLVWVPYTYSIQARYLVDNPLELSYAHIALVLLVNFVGFYIFRGSNSQKDTFRRNPDDPSVRHLKYIKTKRGTRLITSGWWGIARHINYFGDWLMAVAWSLPCGFSHVIPYFYPIYFAVLLIHRERRDDHQCRIKYGSDWDRYCKVVRSRIIPGLY
eukprot:Colp12_sorted_trinity150504_noHs@33677